MKLLELAMAFIAMPAQFLPAADPDVTVVPFGCVNKLAVVQAEADGKKGFFILDTGTPDLTLNDLYFQGERAEKTFYGVNAEALEVQLKFVQINIEGFVKDTEAKIIGFTAIEAYMGLPILGAIGNKVFEDCEVVFDYVFRKFTIYRPNKMGYEFLSHYRTAINFRKKEIYIWDAAYVQEQLAAVQKQGKR